MTGPSECVLYSHNILSITKQASASASSGLRDRSSVDTLQVVFCYHTAAVDFCMLDVLTAERKAPFCASSRGQNLVGFSYIVT